MCGIVGTVEWEPGRGREWLPLAGAAIKHRGPDDKGEWWSEDGRVGFAHQRLAIVDLSPLGHQPMVDSRASLTLVFNGEIYNYRDLRSELSARGETFYSQSDTEVILAAYRQWGIECVSRFNGAFAFGLCDLQRQIIYLARDRAGEKPLFFHVHQKNLRFASELKALLADSNLDRQIDHQSLDCYLATGFVPGGRSILRGFSKLPPAHVLKYSLTDGAIDVTPYWRLPENETTPPNGSVNERALLEELEFLLQSAVLRQMHADVPVGILLSGGVDSSLVTAMAAKSGERVKTFTVRMPQHAKMDETDHARLIANHFGTEHVEIELEQASADILPVLAKQFDEPMADSSMIPSFMLSRLVRKHCSVALGGDGGDELFGGYRYYSRLLLMQRYMALIPRAIRKEISAIGMRILPSGLRGRNWLRAIGMNWPRDLPQLGFQFDFETRKRLMGGKSDRHPESAETIMQRCVPSGGDVLQQATRMDFGNYLPEDILVKVDRASMLNSLELRAPFLDHRLIEFAFSKVPSSLKATSGQRKILLKRLAARLLPPQFNYQRKQGFSIPLCQWLRAGEYSNMFREVLFDKDCVFDREVVQSLMTMQNRGISHSEPLFALALFEMWRREYRVSM